MRSGSLFILGLLVVACNDVTIKGRIVDRLGDGVASAQVQFLFVSGETSTGKPVYWPKETVTDADGFYSVSTYKVPFTEDPVLLRAIKQGYDSSPPEITIQLSKADRVSTTSPLLLEVPDYVVEESEGKFTVTPLEKLAAVAIKDDFISGFDRETEPDLGVARITSGGSVYAIMRSTDENFPTVYSIGKWSPSGEYDFYSALPVGDPSGILANETGDIAIAIDEKAVFLRRGTYDDFRELPRLGTGDQSIPTSLDGVGNVVFVSNSKAGGEDYSHLFWNASMTQPTNLSALLPNSKRVGDLSATGLLANHAESLRGYLDWLPMFLTGNNYGFGPPISLRYLGTQIPIGYDSSCWELSANGNWMLFKGNQGFLIFSRGAATGWPIPSKGNDIVWIPKTVTDLGEVWALYNGEPGAWILPSSFFTPLSAMIPASIPGDRVKIYDLNGLGDLLIKNQDLDEFQILQER